MFAFLCRQLVSVFFPFEDSAGGDFDFAIIFYGAFAQFDFKNLHAVFSVSLALGHRGAGGFGQGDLSGLSLVHRAAGFGTADRGMDFLRAFQNFAGCGVNFVLIFGLVADKLNFINRTAVVCLQLGFQECDFVGGQLGMV